METIITVNFNDNTEKNLTVREYSLTPVAELVESLFKAKEVTSVVIVVSNPNPLNVMRKA